MARGSVVKRTSGVYAIRYHDADGRRRYETIGPNRREAERALDTRMRELDVGTWREPSQETLADYARRWLAQRDPAGSRGGRSRLAASTFYEYRRSLESYVLPRLGGHPLAKLRTVDVDGMIRVLEGEHRAAGTIRNAVTPLRRLLNDAVRQGLIPANPAARADLPPAEDFTGKELPREHTEAIRAALLELAEPDPLREGEPDLFWACLVDVALGTGLRLGELRALRWEDIDRERRVIRVERAYSRSQLKRPKTDAGVRSVPLFPSVASALDSLATRALERGRYAPAELVFAAVSGGPLHPSNFTRRVWAPALQRAGLGEWIEGEDGKRVWNGLYEFRHLRNTCVSRLVADGADVKLVQAVAGHANAAITLNRYSRLLGSRISEAAERFDPGRPKVAKSDRFEGS